MAATTTGQSIPNVEDRHRRIRLANLTKLIDVELHLLMESFQEAKRRIDPVIAQINQARDKFNQLLQQGGDGGEVMMEVEMERELQDLKQTTSKLKSKIPSSLIAPEYQPSSDPKVIFQPRTLPSKPTTTSNTPVVDDDDDNPLYLVPNFSDKLHQECHIVQDFNRSPENFQARILMSFSTTPGKSAVVDDYRVKKNRNARDSVILLCFLAFPQGAFIKSSLLCSYANGVSITFNSSESVVSTACELVSKGFIKSVYKKHSSRTVDGFWMDPFVHHTLKSRLSRELQLQCLVNSTSVDGEDIVYSGEGPHTSTWPSELRFLHLGKWQRSPTHHNIEMPDPNLYFKYIGDMHRLGYISFRGVSAMKELPNFVTNLEVLSILDLKACHHLEVIPSDIGNLWCCLVHLDMSECYFLDHMPASLSRLTRLSVLKGFFVGETNDNEEELSCTLQDLSSMVYLVKLNIHTSLKTFPSEDHLTILQGFEDLRNLTICWGGYPTRYENGVRRPKKSPATRLNRLVNKKFSFSLKKLDLRGAPETGTRDWLKPSNFQKLEKLYIRGGQLSDLRYNNKEAQKKKQLEGVKEKVWSVKILRLRHLSRLQLHWSELQNSFPNVVSVEIVDCPNLTSFPCDDSGLWTKDTTQPPADRPERHGIS